MASLEVVEGSQPQMALWVCCCGIHAVGLQIWSAWGLLGMFALDLLKVNAQEVDVLATVA